MNNINIHIYPSNMTNESRIFKESKFISRNCDFEKIILLGIWKEGLNKDEQYEGNIYIKRVSLFNIKKRSILYLYYFMYVFVFIVLHRPKMINIHTLEFLPLSLIAKIFKIKIIYDTHELETEKANFKGFRKKISKIIEKTFIGFVDKVIVVGEAIADEYKKMYPKLDRPFVVLNTPNYKRTQKNDLFREKFNIDKEKIIFLYQGAISPSRGVEILLETFKETDKVIVFMGYGSLVDKVKEYSFKYKNIYFHEAVKPEVLLNYTSSADVGFCLIENSCKSYDFCMPNKIFEYIMAGIPVIASDLFEMKKIINLYKIGVTIDYKNINILKEKINNISIENIDAFIENIEDFKKKFNWERQEETLREIYINI
ncbi:glycosyltransferase [Aliarcobacter cryaerophilus]|uniref:glycosyltransferase n=1 Tax=Aliarcobacter cryaerophilus TaxID=28198 RepID=UPI003DA20FC5